MDSIYFIYQYFNEQGERLGLKRSWGGLLYDTFKVAQHHLEDKGVKAASKKNIATRNKALAAINNPEIGSGQYGSLPKLTYGKHTVVGKIWSGIWGGANNEVYTSVFSNNRKRRVKVSLYNRNYVIKKVLGLKVKTQKKNWIGWSGTPADEIRLGWDGISFTVKDSKTPANPWPALKSALAPYRPKGSGDNPDWDPNWNEAKKWEINALPWGESIDISRGFQTGVKTLYDKLRQIHGRSIPKNEESTIIAWLNQKNQTTITIAGPNEIIAQNKEELEVELQRFTDFVFTFSTNGNTINWKKSVVGTVIGTKDATKMEMQFASIYGVARFGNIWNGAIIEKSE